MLYFFECNGAGSSVSELHTGPVTRRESHFGPPELSFFVSCRLDGFSLRQVRKIHFVGPTIYAKSGLLGGLDC